jgi:parvulin-like peptidyl-prolyl isomerase
VKRQLPGALVAVVVIASGALASACDATPTAATANGDAISTGTLNTQLQALDTTQAGGCLLQLQSGNLAAVSGTGAGGTGTYTMAFANTVLNEQVGNLLAQQYAASRGITVSAAQLATATSDLQATLDGEISQQVSSATSQGAVSDCQLANGSNLSAKALLAALPVEVRAAQVRNEAIDEELLARGANLSAQAVSAYYNANKGFFTQACVSVIVTDSQAHANQVFAQINGGADFAAVAKANSLDTQTAPNGGSQGCGYSLSQIEQSLQVQSLTVGQPVPPLQSTQSGEWLIVEVTSEQVAPLSAATSLVKRELLQDTTNVQRVSHEIVGFARHSDVSINPQYGTWKGTTVRPPVAPPPQFLLASVGGTTVGSSAALPTRVSAPGSVTPAGG